MLQESLDEDGHKDLVDIMLKLQREAKVKDDEEQGRLLKDTNIGHIVHELFGGGIESTTMSILWFILYLIRHPEVHTLLIKIYVFYLEMNSSKSCL